MGIVSVEQGNHEEAIEHYREAIRLTPDDPRSYNNLAWIRATHPDPALRNGPEAVRLSQRACALWKQREPNLLDTLEAHREDRLGAPDPEEAERPLVTCEA